MDATFVEKAKKEGKPLGTTKERIARGVYFTHVGLTRMAISEYVGADKWNKYVAQIPRPKPGTKEMSKKLN